MLAGATLFHMNCKSRFGDRRAILVKLAIPPGLAFVTSVVRESFGKLRRGAICCMMVHYESKQRLGGKDFCPTVEKFAGAEEAVESFRAAAWLLICRSLIAQAQVWLSSGCSLLKCYYHDVAKTVEGESQCHKRHATESA